jgi:hypothetical protein
MAIGFNKFMNKARSGVRSFASGAAHGIAKSARFLGKEVLPVVEKVAGGVATAAKYAAPVLAFTPLAEFAPAVGAVGLAAGGIAKGARYGQKVIKDATKVADAVSTVGKGVKYISGKVEKPVIEKVKSIAQNVAPQLADAAMRINRPPGMGLKRLGMGM